MSDEDIKRLVREFRSALSSDLETVHIRLDKIDAKLGAIERQLGLHTELILTHQH